MQLLLECLGIGSSRYWQCFIWITDAKAARGQPGYDPLFKIRPIIDTLMTKFQDVYEPEEQLTIDEAICPFRGCIFFRVYIKGKPHKYGIKMFELCEQKVATSTAWKYILGHIPPTQNTTRRSVFLTDCVIKWKERTTVCTWTDGSLVQRSLTIYGVARQRL